MQTPVEGFSKWPKEEKIAWVAQQHFHDPKAAIGVLRQYLNEDKVLQRLHDEFTENALTNFYLPFGVAPNFLINGKYYTLPMVIEESSVVAAASKAAKYWGTRGGFKAQVLSTEKVGQVHFLFRGEYEKLRDFFLHNRQRFIVATQPLTENMRKRGGGLLELSLVDRTEEMEDYYQLYATFDTVDSMGANFINSCLEALAHSLKEEANTHLDFNEEERHIDIVMSILSNYVPHCLVRAEVSCPISSLNEEKNISAESFAKRIVQAVKISEIEPHRAVTHNKGIMNGVDALILATGNDFRAVEAGAHAYAARDGHYASLTKATVEDDIFRFWLDIPLALGTVGGITSLHPMVKLALELLGNPSAKHLMEITAVAGLAQNFAALRSLVTTGIQQGHMKMHLLNILNQLAATEAEKQEMITFFKDRTVSHSAVVGFLEQVRGKQ